MAWQERALTVLSILVLLASVDSFLVPRLKRQSSATTVLSNGSSSGEGDNVDTSAVAHHFKTVDGVIGVNSSSAGNASGAGDSSINNSVYGSVGDTEVSGTGDVQGHGNNTAVDSNIFGQIFGGNQTITNYQHGAADGVGDTWAIANGSSQITLNGAAGSFNSPESIATAGASGSNQSSSNVISNQQLSWDKILAELVGSAQASGLLDASAQVDLGAGNQANGMEVNGDVIGHNEGGGSVNAEVGGSGIVDGDSHDLSNSMSGNTTGGAGQTNLVVGGGLHSNLSGGTSMNGTAEGASKNMTVRNGLVVDDGNGETLGIGYGEINGNGTLNSNASVSVDTSYNEDGSGQVVVNGDGMAIGQNQTSGLNIGAEATLNNSNGMNNYGSAQANGQVQGDTNNLTGNSFLTLDNTGVSGNSMMEGFANSLNGTSSINTSAALQLNDMNGGPRNVSINGGVSATGQNSSVHSVSVVTDYNGQQSLSNYQQASSSSNGSSSASASNSGSFRRRKRHSLGVLYDRLF